MKEIDASEIVTTEENEKIFFSFEVDLKANIISDSKINPTEVEYEKVEWLYASNNKYPEGSVDYDKVGKWMLFINPKWVNQAWRKIKSGIAKGELWDSKVTTNNPKRRVHAVMIYTKDYTNLEDVIRVLDYLERTRLKPKNINIRYKADWQTGDGIYSGGKRRPWIYASETVRELATSNVVADDQPAHSIMHNDSVHQYPCSICHKNFKAEKSLQQHFEAVHYQAEKSSDEESYEEDSVDSWRPDPPIDTDGMWVHPEDFQGKKSFGYFRCVRCIKSWFSAHAFPDYKQGCKKCETMCRPQYLWENLTKKERVYKPDEKDKKPPHDQERCEACIAGICWREFN